MSGKGDDVAGGLPKAVFDSIFNSVTGGNKGTAVEQRTVLIALAKMENSALHPSNGTTSIVEAMAKYVAIAEGADSLAAAATAAEQSAAIVKIVAGLDGLGKLFFDNGPVGTDFVDSTPKH